MCGIEIDRECTIISDHSLTDDLAGRVRHDHACARLALPGQLGAGIIDSQIGGGIRRDEIRSIDEAGFRPVSGGILQENLKGATMLLRGIMFNEERAVVSDDTFTDDLAGLVEDRNLRTRLASSRRVAARLVDGQFPRCLGGFGICIRVGVGVRICVSVSVRIGVGICIRVITISTSTTRPRSYESAATGKRGKTKENGGKVAGCADELVDRRDFGEAEVGQAFAVFAEPERPVLIFQNEFVLPSLLGGKELRNADRLSVAQHDHEIVASALVFSDSPRAQG
ncbi:hypothetical protein NOF55_00020 [Rhizobiaceae bacterium BDR2-2]|uniref:Uncharacterized protein n=1 Tax=Ectorhizobium quercum TaxID=2965071 RepID=A0AAE3MWN6_9HYPH|nr:hypothetical protein [Ectorhizobium quercum]MCX8995489.1 hypothetical protein [Ectorhizobium quercum]